MPSQAVAVVAPLIFELVSITINIMCKHAKARQLSQAPYAGANQLQHHKFNLDQSYAHRLLDALLGIQTFDGDEIWELESNLCVIWCIAQCTQPGKY